jgi:hypothetical protein
MGDISPRRNAFRALLEVFQCFGPAETLTGAGLVCRDWLQVARSQELWICYFHRTFASLPLASTSAVAQFEAIVRQRKVICLVSKANVKLVHVETLVTKCMFIPELQRCRFASWLTLPLGDVIFCGGVIIPEKTYQSSVYCLPYMSETCHILPSMSIARAGAGLCLHKSILYAFGGDNPDNLSSGESFHIQSNHWESLPDMLTPRRSFSPAIYKEDIYLAGGGGSLRTIEIFHINSQEYDVLPVALPYLDSLTCLLVVGTRLIILIRQKMLSWEIDSFDDLQEVSTVPGLFWFSPAGVTSTASRSYISPYYDCAIYTLDHRSFSISKVFDSPSSP